MGAAGWVLRVGCGLGAAGWVLITLIGAAVAHVACMDESRLQDIDSFRTFYPVKTQPNVLFLFDQRRMDFGV